MIFLILSILLIMISFPSVCLDGARSGLLLWFNTVLPAIFPFLIITTYLIFHMKTSGLSSLLLLSGLIGGLPIGAKIVSDLLHSGSISLKKAYFYFTVINNASPAFIMGYISSGLYSSDSLGFRLIMIIFISTVLSSVLCFYTIGKIFINSTEHSFQASCIYDTSAENNRTFDSAVISSISVICKIGSYIIIFSIAGNMFQHISNLLSVQDNSYLNCFILPLIEITTGIKSIASDNLPQNIKTALTAAFVSFGGLSGLAQTYSVTKNSGLSLFYYSLVKILSAIIAFLLIYIIS